MFRKRTFFLRLILLLMMINQVFRFYFVVFLLTLVTVAHGQHLQMIYGDGWGISQFKYGNHELINLNIRLGQPMFVEAYKAKTKKNEEESAWSSPVGRNWNNNTKEFTTDVNWGKTVCRYQLVGDTLFMKITMTNTSPTDTFCGASISLMTLNFGKRPSNFQQFYPYYGNNITAPAAVHADADEYRLFVENVDTDKRVYVGFLEQNGSNGTLYRVWTGTRPFTGMTDFDPRTEIRLAPKQSYSYTVALKFCKSNTPITTASSEAVKKFRNRLPYKLKWNDRRPIGALFMSSYTANPTKNNPRSWSIIPGYNPDFATPEGKAKFRKDVMDYADRSIGHLKEMNAQGMITWDIEGQQYPHPLSYIGSPEILGKMAPEMNVIADEYFNKFRKAGFKTGICLRPDSVIFKGTWIDHIAVKDPAATLIRKITYARKRWGCTIFYIDSNVDPASGQPMDYTVFKKVMDKFPDLLIIPEHKRLLHYGYTAPFENLLAGGISYLPEDITSVYPEAFTAVYVPEGLRESESQNVNNLVNSIKQGNILIFRAWYDDPTNMIIKKAMNISQRFK